MSDRDHERVEEPAREPGGGGQPAVVGERRRPGQERQLVDLGALLERGRQHVDERHHHQHAAEEQERPDDHPPRSPRPPPPHREAHADRSSRSWSERDGEEDHEQDDRLGGGVAHLEVAEGGLVDLEDERLGRVERPALAVRHAVDVVEDAEEGDRADDDQEDDGRPEERERHVDERPPAPGAVDGRGLVVLLRDGLQAGQEDHDLEPEPRPDGGRQDGVERLLRRAQEGLLREARPHQEAVEHADRHRLVEPPPDPGHGDGGREMGHEVERAQERVADADPVEVVGDEKGQREADGDAHDQVLEGVPHDLPEGRVRQETPVVVEADEPARADDVPVGQGREERVGRGVEANGGIEEDGQREERPRGKRPPRTEGEPVQHRGRRGRGAPGPSPRGPVGPYL